MSKQNKNISDLLKNLSDEAFDFYLQREIPQIENSPESPLEFYRNWISFNRPLIIRNAINHWPAKQKWQNNQYLLQKCDPKKIVKVSVTPNGYADAIDTDGNFVMPHEENMTFEEFIHIIENPSDSNGAVHYIQRQNSNLSQEMPELMDDIKELEWAKEAFGKEPDAVNFWMGDQRAVTSTHKDPYENIYCVVKGYKDIILYPPTDHPWLSYKMCSQAIFERNSDGVFHTKILEDQPKIPWIEVDPLNPDFDRFPEYENAHPLKLRLNAGDVLYLPSLWFHHLQQSQGCIAVNFWYDMEFDCKFNYFNLIKNLSSLLKN